MSCIILYLTIIQALVKLLQLKWRDLLDERKDLLKNRKKETIFFTREVMQTPLFFYTLN